MPLLPPHEYVVDRATKQMTITATHPIRRFGIAEVTRVGTAADGSPIYAANPDYHPPINVQEGRFYYDTGEEIPADEVPQYIHDALRRPVPDAAPARRIHVSMEDAEKMARGTMPLGGATTARPGRATTKGKGGRKGRTERPAYADVPDEPLASEAAAGA